MESVLNCGYLDDVTLGSLAETVARDVAKTDETGASWGGYHLNCPKWELVTLDTFPVSDSYLQSFSSVPIGGVPLLGARLFPGSMLHADWSKRCAGLSRAVEQLSSIGYQDALIVLRASFGAPSVQHLQCYLLYQHSALHTLDDHLKSAVPQITNSDLSASQWIQVSRPIKDGGLGGNQTSFFVRTFCLLGIRGLEPYTRQQFCYGYNSIIRWETLLSHLPPTLTLSSVNSNSFTYRSILIVFNRCNCLFTKWLCNVH